MMNNTPLLSSAAYDVTSLNDLKRKAGTDPQGQALQVAKQVEGLFVQMMLKSMRATLPQDGLFTSAQTQMYTSMYDQQIAQQLSEKGLGMADMIVRQMTPAPPPEASVGGVPMMLEQAPPLLKPFTESERHLRAAIPDLHERGATSASRSRDSSDFITRLLHPAQLASATSGIPSQLILAQAALESGWGQREILTREGKPSYNLFGIKASARWQGDKTDIITTEYEDGVAKKVSASFRVYRSYTEGLADYVRLLGNNPRYTAVAHASTPEQGARALQAAGYATDPNYAEKLLGVIRQFRKMGAEVVKVYNSDLRPLFSSF